MVIFMKMQGVITLNLIIDDHFLFLFRHGHALCNDLLTNYATYFRMIDGGSKQASGWR